MNDFMTITKFGNKTRSLRTQQSERKLDSLARFLLWRSIVNCCVLWLRGAFLLGQFPNMELLLVLLSLYSLLNSLYFPGWWNITLFLTGYLCALNYMSKPDHLISLYKVYGESTLLVLNRTLNSINAPLTLSRWYVGVISYHSYEALDLSWLHYIADTKMM